MTTHTFTSCAFPAFALVLAVGTLSTNTRANAQGFDYRSMMSARMKLDPYFDFEEYAASYMQALRPTVYQSCRNDEFQFFAKRKETMELMKRAAEAFSLDQQFTLNTTVTIGNYDFEKAAFPIVESSETHYWYTNRPKYCPKLPSKYVIFLANRELISSISMTPEMAQRFIAGRKNSYGQVNRKVEAIIRFKIRELRPERHEFNVEIVSAHFYADRNRTRLIHSVRKPEDKVQKLINRLGPGEMIAATGPARLAG